MQTGQGVVDEQKEADAVDAEASSVRVAAEVLTPLLEATYRRRHHHRRPRHSFLGSLPVLCAHVVVHTIQY
jgi:hypothetical protein